MNRVILVILVMFFSSSAFAGKFIFPEDELAKESVYPVFDKRDAVRSRNIVTANRFELGAFTGWASDEPIFNQAQFGVSGTYHFDEFHGLNLTYAMSAGGINQYSKEIKSAVGLDYSNAFGPKNYYLAQYQFTGFYGKLSLAKETSINVHIFGLLGAGFTDFGGKQELTTDFGLGQKFYINNKTAVRFEMRYMRYNGPNPASVSKADLNSGNLKVDDFESTSFMTTHMTVGLVFLL